MWFVNIYTRSGAQRHHLFAQLAREGTAGDIVFLAVHLQHHLVPFRDVGQDCIRRADGGACRFLTQDLAAARTEGAHFLHCRLREDVAVGR